MRSPALYRFLICNSAFLIPLPRHFGVELEERFEPFGIVLEAATDVDAFNLPLISFSTNNCTEAAFKLKGPMSIETDDWHSASMDA